MIAELTSRMVDNIRSWSRIVEIRIFIIRFDWIWYRPDIIPPFVIISWILNQQMPRWFWKWRIWFVWLCKLKRGIATQRPIGTREHVFCEILLYVYSNKFVFVYICDRCASASWPFLSRFRETPFSIFLK